VQEYLFSTASNLSILKNLDVCEKIASKNGTRVKADLCVFSRMHKEIYIYIMDPKKLFCIIIQSEPVEKGLILVLCAFGPGKNSQNVMRFQRFRRNAP